MRIFNGIGDLLRELGRIAAYEAKQCLVRLAERITVKRDGVPPQAPEPPSLPFVSAQTGRDGNWPIEERPKKQLWN